MSQIFGLLHAEAVICFIPTKNLMIIELCGWTSIRSITERGWIFNEEGEW